MNKQEPADHLQTLIARSLRMAQLSKLRRDIQQQIMRIDRNEVLFIPDGGVELLTKTLEDIERELLELARMPVDEERTN